MPRGLILKHLRKAASFVAGDLQAGEVGINTANKKLAFSTDGTDVVSSSARDLYVLVNGAYVKKPGNPPKVFYGTADPAVSIALEDGDTWEQVI